jgi:gliding motility-associated-like protein
VQAIANKNCTAEDSIEVKIVKGDAGNGFLVPSAFTPDGDGKNDCFNIRNWGAVTDVRFNVYNRYGLLVFTTTDPAKCWDGTYKGEVLAPAAFIYIISANTVCGPVNRKGTVVLIR